MSKIWIKSPGPNGGCSECSNQTGPCDEGGCVFFNPIPDYDGIQAYPNLAAAESFLSNNLISCFARRILKTGNSTASIGNLNNALQVQSTASLNIFDTELSAQIRFFSRIKLKSANTLSINGNGNLISVANSNLSISIGDNNWQFNQSSPENESSDFSISQNTGTVSAGEYLLNINFFASFYSSVRGEGIAPHGASCNFTISSDSDIELCQIKVKYYDNLEIKILECT